jgi:hypothetical protein
LATLLVAWRVVILVFMAVLLGSALEPIVGRLRVPPDPRRERDAHRRARGRGCARVASGTARGRRRARDAIPAALERARGWADGLSPAVLSTSANTLIDVVARALQPGAPPQPGQIVEAA